MSPNFHELRAMLSAPSGTKCEGCPTNCCPKPGGNVYLLLYPGEREMLQADGVDFGDRVKVFKHGDLPPVEYIDDCPYLDSNQRCTTYEKRPIDCRTFPMFINKRGKTELAIGRCPQVMQARAGFVIDVKSAAWLLWTNLDERWRQAVELLDAQIIHKGA